MSNMQILIVNEAEKQSINLYNKLKRSASNIPVYQDKVESPRNTTIWSLLNGGKDDFYIYDRCGRLAYYVPYPISFLYRPYAQAAILSTYFGEPCGPCPTTAPTVANSNCSISQSNCTIDDSNCTVSDFNCTVSNETTDIVLNATTLTSSINQTISTTTSPIFATNTSGVTTRKQNSRLDRVIQQLKLRFGHSTTESPKQRNERPKTSSSNRHGQNHHRKYGFRFSHRHSQLTTAPTTTIASTTHRIRHKHHQHHRGHHQNPHEQQPTTQSLTSTISPLSNSTVKASIDHVSRKGHKHDHVHHKKGTGKDHRAGGHGTSKHHVHLGNSRNVNSSFAGTNTSINSVNSFPNRSEILTSDLFYKTFYPDYEVILNLALVDWLNKSLPNRTSSSSKSRPATTTPAPTTITTPSLSKQSHLASLVENLKRVKQRQRSELVH